MRYHALATDYDGTIAHHGGVDADTLAALRAVRESGRRLILVTGRELDDLAKIFPDFQLFDRIVAENGGMLYDPSTKQHRVLSEPPPPAFAARLQDRGVGPISVGHVVVATWEPHDAAVLETIRDMGLELQVIFNKGAVMVLPSGVNKATGLQAALKELGLSRHNVVAVGDAENDHAFLAICECSAAVANALPALKNRADLVLENHHGAGVVELIEHLIRDDLASAAPKLQRHRVLIGRRQDGGEEWLDPFGESIMICGTSGGGKTTLTTGLLERLSDAGYQFLIVDPEGDYQDLDFSVELGDPQRPPAVHEILEVLGEAGHCASVNLLGLSVDHRPGFYNELAPRLAELRTRSGRPHWVVVDEAHHLMPTEWQAGQQVISALSSGMLLITVHPEAVSPAARERVSIVLVVGGDPARTIEAFCHACSEPCPQGLPEIAQLGRGEVLLWRRHGPSAVVVRTPPPRSERRRHSRKYAEGNLGAERSFYFRGADGKLNLKAHNLFMFLQIADGVDADTWEHHRRQGEYSRWMGDGGVKDDALAAEVEKIERDDRLDPDASRAAVRQAVERRYTLPADKPSGRI